MVILEEITVDNTTEVVDAEPTREPRKLYKVFVHYAKPHQKKANGALAIPPKLITILSEVFNRAPESLAPQFVELFNKDRTCMFETPSHEIAETKTAIANARAAAELPIPYNSKIHFTFDLA